MNVFSELSQSFMPGQDGATFMWVLLAMAVSAVFLVVERWLDIRNRTNVNAEGLTEKLKVLIRENRQDEAFKICVSGGKRALPRILGAGIKRAKEHPDLIRSAMEEESLHMLPQLEKRLPLILMIANVSTLVGLMGTIYGLILSFAAVGRPGVAAVEKSSLLASGISTAMNTTLFGLMISVPCILMYSFIRSKVDQSSGEIDRYAVSILKSLIPADEVSKDYKISGKRIKQEVDTEPNIAPMMNLMVILIPLLLTSAEFVKIGAIELKLPESSQGGTSNGNADNSKKDNVKLNLGVIIKASGFDIFSSFDSVKTEDSDNSDTAQEINKKSQIPTVNGEYDFKTLNAELAKIKQKVLLELLRTVYPGLKDDISIDKLSHQYLKKDYSDIPIYKDHDNIKIVAEDTIKYQTVISVMDAARVTKTATGRVPMFTNVSIAGGVVQ